MTLWSALLPPTFRQQRTRLHDEKELEMSPVAAKHSAQQDRARSVTPPETETPILKGQIAQFEVERVDQIRATVKYTAKQLTELLIQAGLTVVEQNGTVSLQPIKALDSEVVDNFDGSYTVTNKVTQCAVLAVQTKVQAAWQVLSNTRVEGGELVFQDLVHENRVTSKKGLVAAPAPTGSP